MRCGSISFDQYWILSKYYIISNSDRLDDTEQNYH